MRSAKLTKIGIFSLSLALILATPAWAQVDLRCDTYAFNAGEYLNMRKAKKKKLSMLWNFGDGQSSPNPIVRHTYAKPGEYTAVLTVRNPADPEAEPRFFSETINVHVPPEADFADPVPTCVDEKVVFDGSPSQTLNTNKLKYFWDLGDGTQKKGPLAKYAYRYDGDYKVKLMVDDNAGKEECSLDITEKTIHVNAPPHANAGKNLTLRCLQDPYFLKITFNATNSYDTNPGDTLSYSWDFGDGKRGKGGVVTHQYETSGHYQVVLTVEDDSGLACNTSQDIIYVNLGLAPQAEAGPDAVTCVGMPIRFDGSDSYIDPNEIVHSMWEYGDTDRLPGLKSSHIYKKAGDFEARLTIDYALSIDCPSSVDTRRILVNTPPEVRLEGPKYGELGKGVILDASETYDYDEDRLTFVWDFGDGTTKKGRAKIKHVYKKAGTYNVTLVVDDNAKSGCSRVAATHAIHITR